MSSSAILILSSSAAAIKTRCFLSPAVGAKECRWCNSEGNRLHQNAYSCKYKAVFRLLKTKTGDSDGYYARANSSKTSAKAGLSRYSGAIHGNSKGKSRGRRRQPGQQDEQENCDEHQEDSKSGGDDTLTTTKSEEEIGESTAGDAACEALAAAEGVIDEDVSIDDASQQLSYNRYLLEIGIDPRSLRGNTDSNLEFRESDLQAMQDESSPNDNALPLSGEGHLPENGAFSQGVSEAGGQGGDLGDEETEESGIKRATNAERGRANVAEKIDSVPENEPENERGSISEDKISPVATTLSPTPDLVPKTSLFNDAVFGNVDSVSETENSRGSGSVSDGRTAEKKRRKKLKSKAVPYSSLNFEERGDNDRVRASADGAERPATPSDKGMKAFPALNWSVTAFKDAEGFEPKVDFGTGEVPKGESGITAVFPVAEPVDRNSKTSVFLDIVGDSKSTNVASNEEPKEEAGFTSVFPGAESVNGDDESSVLLVTVVGSRSTNDTSNEGPQEEADIKARTTVFPVAELADRNGESSDALESVAESNSTNDTGNEDKAPDEPLTVLGEVGSPVPETVLGQVVETAAKVVPIVIVEQTVETVVNVASKIAEIPVVVAQQAAQVGGQVVEILPDVVTEQVGQVVDQVGDFAEQFGHAVDVVSNVAEEMANVVNEQVEHVAESVSNTASQVADQVTNGVETVTSTASAVVEQVTEFFSSDEDYNTDSDDEFESYITSDLPEFRGRQGLNNFIIKQEDQGVLSKIYDIYTYMLKQSFPKFAAAMFFTPIFVSGVFTLLYLPEFEGLAFDETARDFFTSAGGDSMKLHISWNTIFQVFMFSLSLSTGLQPELAPLSPYTLVVANLNALVAQLVFVFLSGAVFARLSQPSQPLKCSAVALVSSSPAQRRRKDTSIKVFMARYVLSGPQPCELVDVKVDLTYKYNTHTRTGSYFRATQSLKLVRPEIAFLTHGMLVRHVIDENSPLYQRTPEMLDKEDAVFCLSVVGLERASMQSVFHVQHYSVVDNDLIWDAEFEDIVLINKKNRRVVDHSRLSLWRPVTH